MTKELKPISTHYFKMSSRQGKKKDIFYHLKRRKHRFNFTKICLLSFKVGEKKGEKKKLF